MPYLCRSLLSWPSSNFCHAPSIPLGDGETNFSIGKRKDELLFLPNSYGSLCCSFFSSPDGTLTITKSDSNVNIWLNGKYLISDLPVTLAHLDNIIFGSTLRYIYQVDLNKDIMDDMNTQNPTSALSPGLSLLSFATCILISGNVTIPKIIDVQLGEVLHLTDIMSQETALFVLQVYIHIHIHLYNIIIHTYKHRLLK